MFPRSCKNQENFEKGFVLNLAKEHLTLIQQKYDYYFYAINTGNMTGFEILSHLMWKCQQKNCPCVFEKISFEEKTDRTPRLKFNEVQLDMFWISIKEEYKQISNYSY